MASRSLTVDNTAPTTEDVLGLMFENDAYEDAPYTFSNLAVELDTENGEIIKLLNNVEDTFVDNDRQGNVWFVSVYASKDEMLAAYLLAHPSKPKPTRKAAAPKAQTGTTRAQVAKDVVSAKVVTPTPENAPVDNKEDAPMNENNTPDAPATPAAPVAPKGWENDGGETHMVEYKEGEPITGHTILPAPENMPAPPEGVNPNMWELYKAADTLPGRAFWGGKVAEQIKAHAERVEAVKNAPAPVAPVITAIDPVTGEPFPF